MGDLLETEDGRLRIFKFVGFEEAQWAILEPTAEAGPGPANEAEVAAAART